MSVGINTRQLGPHSAYFGAPVFVLEQATVAATATYKVFDKNAPSRFRIINVWGIMTGEGGVSDTVKITDGTNNITNDANVSALADTDVFDFAKIDDLYYQINKGGSLYVVTASGALCNVYIMCMKT